MSDNPDYFTPHVFQFYSGERPLVAAWDLRRESAEELWDNHAEEFRQRYRLGEEVEMVIFEDLGARGLRKVRHLLADQCTERRGRIYRLEEAFGKEARYA